MNDNMYGDSAGRGSRFGLACGLLYLLASLCAPSAAWAALHPRGPDMVYDDVLNVTFLANANYAKEIGWVTSSGRSVATTNGLMTFAEAQEFVSQLVFAGHDDWRLPKGSWCGTQWGYCPGGELNHLYHRAVTFDPPGYWSRPLFCSDEVRSESGNDAHVQPTGWDDCTNTWVGTGYVKRDVAPLFTVPDYPWGTGDNMFWTGTPPQVASNPSFNWVFTLLGSTTTWYVYAYVWAVRDGDVNVVVDADDDGVPDNADNCTLVPNTNQTDNDADGQGDACDTDDDNDTRLDGADNCPLVANASQADTDGDSLGDVCDADLDNDGFENAADNCPAAANPDQTDTDGDRVGDECDLNDDNDGLLDAEDNCPAVPNNGQEDLDGDNIGDFCDSDIDGDGTGNEADNCPVNPNVGQDDADGDGPGDACDTDDDNDGVADAADNCPLMVNASQSDQDGDGLGDVCDGDRDGDGAANGVDNCPLQANPDQRDFDGDALGDACDPDADGDGVTNGGDSCAWSDAGQVVDSTGCSIAQLSPCTGPAGTVMPWRNKGKYVSSVAQSAKRFAQSGLISVDEQAAIVAAAGTSSCGQ